MAFLGTLAALAALVAGPQGGSTGVREEVADALARLSDARAAERQAGERWLAANLAPADLPALAAAAASTEPELLRRLEIALGSDERHFELCALLCADSHAPARRLGEAALERLTVAWMGEEGLEPASSLQVLRGIVDRAAPRLALDLREGDFARVLDALVRAGGDELRPRVGSARIEVVLDPQVLGQVFQPLGPGGAPAPRQEGDLGALLFALASVQGLELEGFGFSGGPRAPTWVHLVGQAQAGRRDAADLIADWSRDLLNPREGRRRAGAARALSTCGWGAPLAWLERRWHAGDGAALEGVLLAASRGRVVPSLASSRRVREVLAEAERALAARDATGDALAELAMHALGALPAFSDEAGDLQSLLAEGWDGLDSRRRALRLGALCELGSAPDELLARARADLGSTSSARSVAERLELCRLLARAGPDVPVPATLAAPRELLDLALARDLGETWIGWLRAGGLRLPREWRAAAEPVGGLSPWPRLLIAQAWLEAGDSEAALAHLRALAAAPLSGDAVRVLEHLAGLARGPEGAGLRAALAAEGPAGAARLALFAGALPRDRHQAELERALSGEGGFEALLALWPLAGDPESPACAAARQAILGLARPALGGDEALSRPDAPWAVVFERAWRELVAAGDDQGAEAWRRQLAELLAEAAREDRARARNLRRMPLWAAFAERSWPALGGNPPRPLAALESPLPGA